MIYSPTIYMTEDPPNVNWDFSQAIRLIHSLSSHDDIPPSLPALRSWPAEKEASLETIPTENHTAGGLGNFDKIWAYLDQPLGIDHSSIKLKSLEPKGVRWHDELDDAGKGLEKGSERALTKKERRKLRRHKALGALEHSEDAILEQAADVESEAEIQKPRLPPALKATLHRRDDADQNNGYSSSPPYRTYIGRDTFISTPKAGYGTSPFGYNGATMHIEPLVPMSAAQRKAELIMKLHKAFPEDKIYLMGQARLALSLTGSTISHSGIHVFVDASNILIGFYKYLKVVRGIPESAKVRRAPISFHSLALILERGRPAAKRVLVGSSSEVVKEAKQCGYETNILDKVHKAKELTPRQLKYRSGYGTSGQSSGSDTNGPMLAPKGWVEQAVDEILHLKMLESLVDELVPSTIVLATGDAAEAEFSAGFLKMVERALSKGWKVELVSFSANISWAYRKKEFRSKWKDEFRIIELDDFSEELLA